MKALATISETRLAMLGFGASVAFILVLGGLSIKEADRGEAVFQLVEQSRERTVLLQEVLAGMTEAETANRGYLLTGQEAFLESYLPGMAAARDGVAELGRQMSRVPGERQQFLRLTTLIDEKIRLMQSLVETGRQARVKPSPDQMLSSKTAMDKVREMIDGMMSAEQTGLRESLGRMERQSTRTRRTLAGTVVAAVVLLGAGTLRRLGDIRRRAAADEALQASEERYALVVRGTSDGLWDWNVRTDEVYYGPRFMELLGFTPDEFPHVLETWKARLHPDEVASVLEAIQAHFDRREPYDVEYRLRNKAGEWRWFRARGQAIWDAQGRPERMAGSISDITRRKWAEAGLAAREQGIRRLYEITASANTFDGAVEAALRTACRIFGMETGLLGRVEGDRLIIERIHNSQHPELAAGVILPLADTLGGRVAAADGPIGFVEAAGTSWADHPSCRRFHIESFCGVPIRTRSRTYGVFEFFSRQPRAGAFSDAELDLLRLVADWVGHLLDLQQHQERLKLAKEEADRANHAKSEFLSRMSHELRTPLNGVLGFAQLLEVAGLPERQAKNVQRILKAGRHLLELINEVLDIARVESGGLGMSPEPVDVCDTVREVTELLRPLAAERDITIESAAGEAGLLVLADRQRLKQVLLNLGGNGIKYNRRGGRLTFGWRRQPGRLVRLEVRDTGPGIAAADQAKIFTPFERLKADQTGVEGTGLGLALCERLVTAMKGKIGVESRLDQGSTFWFELTEAVSGVPKLKSDSQVFRREAFAGDHPALTVLYIEDNLENVQLMEEVLQLRPGVELVTAMQASVGLQLARSRRPDLIFLDLHLPDQNGDAVLGQLKADDRTKDIPVVMLTADAMRGQERRLRELGARDYVTKPIEVRTMMGILDSLKPGNP